MTEPQKQNDKDENFKLECSKLMNALLEQDKGIEAEMRKDICEYHFH